MAKGKGRQYPDVYGTPIKGAHVDMLTPLTVEQEGDSLVPKNDMKAVAGRMGDAGYVSPDPLDLIKPFGDGTKG